MVPRGCTDCGSFSFPKNPDQRSVRVYHEIWPRYQVFIAFGKNIHICVHVYMCVLCAHMCVLCVHVCVLCTCMCVVYVPVCMYVCCVHMCMLCVHMCVFSLDIEQLKVTKHTLLHLSPHGASLKPEMAPSFQKEGSWPSLGVGVTKSVLSLVEGQVNMVCCCCRTSMCSAFLVAAPHFPLGNYPLLLVCVVWARLPLAP